ncbi:MAG: universal stress protein [Burkholderiales bacterium]|nr:universal stress protein [Burkholderiales bacterium]
MLTANTILLAYHGTDGAKRAEALAYDIISSEEGGRIVHLLVVPEELWAGMQGDDWLNNASTRDTFGSYVEGMLEKDAAEQVAAVEAHCKQRGLAYTPILRVGDLADCLVAAARDQKVDLVVIGPPRSKKESGLRSRMELDTLGRGLPVPYVVASGE